MVKSNQFQIPPSSGNFSCDHSISATGFHLLQCTMIAKFYLIFFSPPQVLTTPRDKVLILKHLQLFPIIIIVAFSSCCCLTSSPHAYKTQTQHQQSTNTLQSGTHTTRAGTGEDFVYPSNALGGGGAPHDDSTRVLFSGVKNFVTIFKMLPN